MTVFALTLGALRADGFDIHRSGVRWIKETGYACAANETLGYFNISLSPLSVRSGGQSLDEADLQVAFAAPVAGVLQLNTGASRGGYLNVLGVHVWDPAAVIGYLEPLDAVGAPGDELSLPLRLIMLAGRRATGLADVHSGLLPGWHSRKRAWWAQGGQLPVTLLSLGICDATGLVLGDQSAFLEMFEGAPGAAQMVFIPDHPLAPCAPTLLEQYQRTPAQFNTIQDDLTRGLSDTGVALTPDDWTFAGALLGTLNSAPLRDHYDILSPTGTQRLGPCDAVLLSSSAEPASLLRHKQLGYHLSIMRHYQAAAGPAVRRWLSSAFEPVRRSISDIQGDYIKLVDTVSTAQHTRFLILNRMSTSGSEDVSNYRAFDKPMSNILSSIAAKEINLMLYDLAEGRDVDILDVDLIAADLGGGEHLPDGIHQSGAMQAQLRHKILAAMEQCRTS